MLRLPTAALSGLFALVLAACCFPGPSGRPSQKADGKEPAAADDAADFARGETVRRGDWQVAVAETAIAAVPLAARGVEVGASEREHLIVRVRVRNLSTARPQIFRPWRLRAVLRDDLGGRCAPADYDGGVEIDGAAVPDSGIAGQVRREVVVAPGREIVDLLAFERPAAAARSFVLELPGDSVGGGAPLRFRFPRSPFWRD
ncbi:MAG TPA: hypothetical protein VFA26_05345 [Gemmataceae bacterium]|nr:hypothetical protein [Gemmataceae bacterium]